MLIRACTPDSVVWAIPFAIPTGITGGSIDHDCRGGAIEEIPRIATHAIIAGYRNCTAATAIIVASS